MSRNSRGTLFVIFALVLITTLATVSAAKARTGSTITAWDAGQDETQSVTGTIAAISDNSFTLTLGAAVATQAQDAPPKAMTFVIDKNTTVDGKLRVGSSAEVTYRQENSNNVAINVRVATRTGE